MSIIRDIRLTVATHLSLPAKVRYAFASLLNEVDMELDREGYEPSERVKKAQTEFELALFDLEDVKIHTNEGDIFAEDPEFVDIDDIDFIDPSTEE
jgi:hypothetical protein